MYFANFMPRYLWYSQLFSPPRLLHILCGKVFHLAKCYQISFGELPHSIDKLAVKTFNIKCLNEGQIKRHCLFLFCTFISGHSTWQMSLFTSTNYKQVVVRIIICFGECAFLPYQTTQSKSLNFQKIIINCAPPKITRIT